MTATARITSLLSGAVLGLGLLAGAAPAAHADGSHLHSGSRHDRAGAEVNVWTQGKSQSDPDGDSNGGMDKPGFGGGIDDDRDGNNGCGNDTDREDDNNGHCGRPGDAQAQAAQEKACDDQDKTRHEAEAEAGDDDDADRDDEAEVDDDSKSDDEADDDESRCPESDGIVSAAGTVSLPATRVEAAVAAAPLSAGTSTAAATPGTTVAGAVDVAGTDTTTTTTAGTQVLGITETRPDTLARTGAGLGGLAAAAGFCLGGGRLFGLVRRLLGS